MVSFGDVLGIAAPILGAFGKAKNTQQAQATSGFETMPAKVKDYLLNTAYDDIIALRNEPRPSIPFRRADASDYDPIFGSQARVALQRYYDEKAMPKEEKPKGKQTDDLTKQPTQSANLDNALMQLRMMAGNPERDVTPQAKQAQDLLRRIEVAKNMDGYKNEYTGKTFNLGNLTGALPQYLSALSAYGNAPMGMSPYMSKEQSSGIDTVSQELDNALRRPPKSDLLGKAVASWMLGPVPALGLTSITGRK